MGETVSLLSERTSPNMLRFKRRDCRIFRRRCSEIWLRNIWWDRRVVIMLNLFFQWNSLGLATCQSHFFRPIKLSRWRRRFSWTPSWWRLSCIQEGTSKICWRAAITPLWLFPQYPFQYKDQETTVRENFYGFKLGLESGDCQVRRKYLETIFFLKEGYGRDVCSYCWTFTIRLF